MGQVVKKILVCLFLTQSTFAQEWQTIPTAYFNSCCNFTSEPAFQYKKFKINPYTNDLWMMYGNSIHHLTNEGVFQSFTPQNEPLFVLFTSFLDFAFTPDSSVFAIKADQGLFRNKNDTWEYVLQNINPNAITSNKDTLLITQTSNKNYYKYFNDNALIGDHLYFKRIAYNEDNFWVSSGNEAFITYYENGTTFSYDPDTCKLLDVSNYDFKFSPLDGRLYVAGDRGLSVAAGRTFTDTISAFSSSNMPDAGIIEFEFDNKNNIWALIGSNSNNVLYENHALAYYEQATRTWTQYYDDSNSPIDFSQLLTIEVDTAGNLWVAERERLHVLKINNLPNWLATTQLPQNKQMSVYPNPSNNQVRIQLPQLYAADQRICLVNTQGQVMQEVKFGVEKKFIELPSTAIDGGVYFIQWWQGERLMETQKWVKL